VDLEAGAAAFKILATHLRAAGEDGLRKELDKAISDAAEPLKQEIRLGLRPHMPNRYADVLNADLRLTISKRTGPDPGVTLRATAAPGRAASSSHARRSLTGRKLARLNEGRLTHPLWGNREHWYTQAITPAFFTGPAEASAPRVRRAILDAMNRIADRVTRKV
jgi:hypothetical protein